MFFKKSKENKREITLELLLEVGVPPIFATIIIKRINELTSKNPNKKAFEPHDFCTIFKGIGDQQKIASIINRGLNQ